MGGKLSSLLLSLYLMTKELHNAHLSLYGNRVFHNAQLSMYGNRVFHNAQLSLYGNRVFHNAQLSMYGNRVFHNAQLSMYGNRVFHNAQLSLYGNRVFHNAQLSMYGNRVFQTRYKDNIYVCGPPRSVFPQIHRWCATLSALYAIPVQVEGFGDTLDVLESTLQVTQCGLSLRLKCKTLDLLQCGGTKPFRRWPDAWALNCKAVMQSLVPGCAAKCPVWALSGADIALNVQSVCMELGFKGIHGVIPLLWHLLCKRCVTG